MTSTAGATRATRVAPTAVLAVAGVVAIAVGAAELLTPVSFREGYGIDMGDNTNLFSETRAAGGGLAAVGVVIALGAVVRSLAPAAALLGASVYGAYGLSRALSMVLDGRPEGGLVTAAVVELVIGLVCALLLIRPGVPEPGTPVTGRRPAARSGRA